MILGWLLACTPEASDLVLVDRDRHWATGDVYRAPDGACDGVIDQGSGTAQVTLENAYLQTTVELVRVGPECEELGRDTIPAGDALSQTVNVPLVLWVEAEGELLSTWQIYFPLGAGTIHVQP